MANNIDSGLWFDATHDDIEWLANILVDLGLVATIQPGTSVEVLPPDILDGLDLESVASSVAGITDPLGQLRQWLEEALKSIAEWIVNSIRGIFEPILASIGEALGWVTNAIQGIASALQSIYDALSKVVVQPLLDALSWVENVFPTIISMFENLTSTVSQLLSGLAARISDVVSSVVDAVSSRVQGILATLTDVVARIVDMVSGIPRAISDAVSSILSTVRAFVDNIISGLQTVISMVEGFTSRIQSVIGSLIDQLASTVGGIVKTISSALAPVIDTISRLPGLISNAVSAAISAISDAVSGIVSALSTAVARIDELLSHIPRAVSNIVSSIIDSIRGFIDTVRGMVDSLISRIIAGLQQVPDVISNIIGAVTSSATQLANVLSNVFAMVESFISSLPQLIQSIISRIADVVSATVSQIATSLRQLIDIVQRLPDVIDRAVRESLARFRKGLRKIIEEVKPIVEPIIKPFADAFKAAIDALNSFISSAANYIQSAVNTIANFIANLPSMATKAVADVERFVWEHLPEPVKRFMVEAPKALQNVAKITAQLPNIIAGIPEAIAKFFEEYVVKPLKPVIDVFNYIGGIFEAVASQVQAAIQVIVNEFTAFVSNPVEWIKDKLSLLAQLLGFIVKLVFGGLTDIFETIYEAVRPHSPSPLKPLLTVFGKILGTLSEVATDVAVELLSFMADMSDRISRALSRRAAGQLLVRVIRSVAQPWLIPVLLFVPTIAELAVEKAPELIHNPIQFMYELLNRAVLASFASILLTMLTKPLIAALEDVEADVAPAGLGAKIRIAVGKAAKHILESVERVFPDVMKYIIIGHMIWWAEPTRAITRRSLAEYVTIELPPINDTIDALRRRLFTVKAADYYRMLVDQLMMGGIYKGFIDNLWPVPRKLMEDIEKRYPWVFATYNAELDAVWVEDRWGVRRYFPASLVFSIPTPSELARMMIRDIILDPRFFAAVMGMHGFHPDIALMFYLLHFRYPSPEKLADFFWRGVAGELWNPDKSYDKAMAETFFPQGRAPKPVAPRELNFRGEKLFEMIKNYMKWHDYSRLPWRDGWPTDNAIVVELMTDIPGKIDLRWMTRWGLFDYWAAHGVELTTTIEEITRGLLVEGSVLSAKPLVERYLSELSSGQIVFDVRQFARALQATGMHPYWVPWVTIAETINALTEERTLLRTGFINLFREGLWSLQHLNMLLSGFFTVVFRTGYYDFTRHEWKNVEVEVPVAFLPAESKLLELRAVMDKALDIYREAYRYLIRSTLYYVIDVDEAYNRLQRIVESINKSFFSNEIAAITGKELSLSLDRGYWDAWREYVKVLQDVEAKERTRFYARYLIWSVLWGLRWGYTTYEEALKWVEDLVAAMHEHRYVYEAIRLSVDFMLQRFYKEMGVRRIVNLLRSRRISVEEAVEELKRLGFSEKDARLYIDAQVLWYTPSITTYATMVEIVPEALNMSLQSLKVFNLPEDELPYWRLYMVRKTIQDELTLLRTRIYNALAEGMSIDELVELLSRYMVGFRFTESGVELVPAERAKELLAVYDSARQVFEAYGIAPHEWVLYNLIAVLEKRVDELRQAARERIPTPSTMAVLAEYLVLPEELVKKTLERYHVSREWLPYWLQYIRVKPIKSDAKQLLTAYLRALRYGAVTRKEVEDFIKKLTSYGFTPVELDLIEKRVDLEEAIVEARELRRAYLPTPSMLATLAEYVYVPPELIEEVLVKRRVPEHWVRLWLQYIRVRPVADEARLLATAYFRALRYGVPLGELGRKALEILRSLGFTREELEIRELRAAIEAAIDQWREAQREYIPTPAMLASMAEYVPAVRRYARLVFEARRVPEAWRPIWLQYIALRPLRDEVRRYASAVMRLFEYFAITEDDFRKALDRLKPYGYEDAEISLLYSVARLDQSYRAYRELIGTPRELASMAEYSPRARRLALAQVYKMIDALPVDQQTKEFLKKMWEEYIHVRPVYDEVRRYVTELVNDYANGVIDYATLARELEELKQWGLDDYEIQFYLWLAEKRRLRYMARRRR